MNRMLQAGLSVEALALAFLPDGGLLASTEKGLLRLDAAATKVLAKRKGRHPPFVVGPEGTLFVAEKNKVFACDAVKLSGKPVKLPAGRGAQGAWAELAISPSGGLLAAATLAGDAVVLELKSGKTSACPAHGAAHRGLSFLDETELCSVREGNVGCVAFATGHSRQLGTSTFGVGREGLFVGWDHTSTLTIIDAAKRKPRSVKLPNDGQGTQVALVPGDARAVAASGGALCLVDLEKAKVSKRVKCPSASAIAVSPQRVAVCAGGRLLVGDLDDVFG